MTSFERMYALYQATCYIEEKKIPGDIVECGVWRGGSAMVSAITLKKLNNTKRKIYLYDTYEGMTKPTQKDKTLYELSSATPIWEKSKTDTGNAWCYASLEEVQHNLYQTKYPKEKLVFVKGDVLKTISQTIPQKIAILRLDTDWYDSTHHELVKLFPRIVQGGILILDDYGHWKGAKDAVYEYFAEHKIKILLHRVDYSGRIGIKM